MIRRTITLPADLASDIDALVASGAAPNVSRFLQDAARRHVAALQAERLAVEAARLDTTEEARLARRAPATPASTPLDEPAPPDRIPWSSLREAERQAPGAGSDDGRGGRRRGAKREG